jgi:VCBS repeat-containing protein
VWSAAPDTCNITSPQTIASGETWTIASGIFVELNASVTVDGGEIINNERIYNYDLLINDGTITSSNPGNQIRNFGTITNNNIINSFYTNNQGHLINYGNFIIFQDLDNSSGGLVDNYGFLHIQGGTSIDNFAGSSINNYADITNDGRFDTLSLGGTNFLNNHVGGTIQGTGNFNIDDGAIWTNNDQMFVEGLLINEGRYINGGGSSLLELIGGTFENKATGTVVNDGVFLVLDGATLDDSDGGLITNNLNIEVDCLSSYSAGLQIGPVGVDVCEPNTPPTTVPDYLTEVDEDDTGLFPVVNENLTSQFDDIEDGAAGLTYSAVSDNTDLITVSVHDNYLLDVNLVPDSFGIAVVTMTATDSEGLSVDLTNTVTVNPVNDAPVATPNNYNVNEDGPQITESPEADDTDIENDILSITAVTTPIPNKGIAGFGSSITYNPNGEFESLAVGETEDIQFDYTVSDGNGGTDTATVTITVDGQNDQPTANDDGTEATPAATTDEDATLGVTTINVLTNDTDPDSSDVLSVSSVNTSSVEGGTVSDNGDGTFSYIPPNDDTFQYLGTGEFAFDTFDYTVSDGNGGSDTATVTIKITGINDAPTFDLGVTPFDWHEAGTGVGSAAYIDAGITNVHDPEDDYNGIPLVPVDDDQVNAFREFECDCTYGWTVTDSEGLATEKIRDVYVRDTIPPEFTTTATSQRAEGADDLTTEIPFMFTVTATDPQRVTVPLINCSDEQARNSLVNGPGTAEDVEFGSVPGVNTVTCVASDDAALALLGNNTNITPYTFDLMVSEIFFDMRKLHWKVM